MDVSPPEDELEDSDDSLLDGTETLVSLPVLPSVELSPKDEEEEFPDSGAAVIIFGS